MKGARVVDMNKTTQIPASLNKKKNKNDFYRFLLSQNNQRDSGKINNDILIPRSILKKCGEKARRKVEEANEEEEFPMIDQDGDYSK